MTIKIASLYHLVITAGDLAATIAFIAACSAWPSVV